MKRWIVPIVMCLAILGWSSAEAARATGPMTLTGFLCAKASEGTSCLGDYPAGGGSWDGPTEAVALEANDTAFVFLSGGVSIYRYATGSISDDSANTPPRTVAASGGGGWNLQPINPASVTISKVSGTAGETCVYEANSTDTTTWCIRGPASMTANLSVQMPDADPSGGQVLSCGTPSSNVSTCTWVTPATLSGTNAFTGANTIGDAGDDQIVKLNVNSNDGTFSGFTITRTVDSGATASFGQAMYVASDGELASADADSASTGPCVCILVTAGTGASKQCLTHGTVTETDWNWTVGGIIYLSTDPSTTTGLTQTAPSGTGDVVQVLGVALHADTILFQPSLVQVVLE